MSLKKKLFWVAVVLVGCVALYFLFSVAWSTWESAKLDPALNMRGFSLSAHRPGRVSNNLAAKYEKIDKNRVYLVIFPRKGDSMNNVWMFIKREGISSEDTGKLRLVCLPDHGLKMGDVFDDRMFDGDGGKIHLGNRWKVMLVLTRLQAERLESSTRLPTQGERQKALVELLEGVLSDFGLTEQSAVERKIS